MKKGLEKQMIRQLGKDEEIPFDLLLLADPTEEAIKRYIFNSDIYVLEQNDNIIGVFVLQAISSDEIEIKNIAVAANCQGRGFGRLMLRDATIRAKEKGFKAIVVGTGDVSAILRFYRKEGFELFGARENFFVDNYSEPIYEEGIQLKDMVVLRKVLV
ncbi:MAG: GNAT family N-acetyltransferase [Candidatus Bathyarchaeota archaeon]|nr:GNAT family N-acetyltransferase [Candidatus Bathyarchaeota archaeon]